MTVLENKLSREEIIEKAKELNHIHTSWKDYALFLLNTSDPESRDNWREKFITSMIHWRFNTGSISESNMIGLEVMSSLPSKFTESVVDDSWDRLEWYRDKRLPGSKKQVVCLGHYPQESISNEANLSLKAILDDWDNKHHLIFESDYISRMWDFAQKSGGAVVTQDEILTYTLDKPIDERVPAYWVDVAEDVIKNGVEDFKYKKEYRTKVVPGYPLAEGSGLEWIGKNVTLTPKLDENGKAIKGEFVVEDVSMGDPLTLEEMKDNFIRMIDVILKEDVAESPCYKKLAITILKNDKVGQYMGFSATYKERRARANSMAAFSRKESEINNAIKESAKLDILEAKEEEKKNKNK